MSSKHVMRIACIFLTVLLPPMSVLVTADEAVADGTASRFSTAGFFAVPNGPRSISNFNPGWRFIKADVSGAERPDFDDSTWESANVPHGLEILGENESGCHRDPFWGGLLDGVRIPRYAYYLKKRP